MSNWMMEALEALNDATATLGGRVEAKRDDALERVSDWIGDLGEWIGIGGEPAESAPPGSANAASDAAARVLGRTGEQLGLGPEGAAIDPDRPIAVQPPAAVAMTLQRGDNDKRRVWGGVQYLEEGDHVSRLQRRLVELGYWVSGADREFGMKCDGDYGVSTAGAVATFQIERLAIDEAGEIDESKVTGNCDETTLAALRAAGGRPTHSARNAVRNANSSAATVEPTPFIQLPPSRDYLRYSPNYDNGGEHPVLSGRHFRIMSDNWGQPALIEMIRAVADAWLAAGMERLLVGDIARFAGGTMPPHKTHQFGMGVDIDHDRYCSVNRDAFEVDNALRLANLFEAHGATVVYFNCHHVISNCTIAKYAGGHHHHFHVDREFGHHNRTRTTCANCNKIATCPRRILKVAKKGAEGSETGYSATVHGTVYRDAESAPTGAWYVTAAG